MSNIKPIDGTALLKEFGDMNVDEYDYEVYSEIFDMIEQAPELDYKPTVHARWIISSDGYYPYCSNCRQEPEGRALSTYCPHCGARMDKEESQ